MIDSFILHLLDLLKNHQNLAQYKWAQEVNYKQARPTFIFPFGFWWENPTKTNISGSTMAEITSSSSTSTKIDVFWNDEMLKHDTGNGVFDSGMDPGFLDVLDKHPENSDRLRNMVSILRRGPISPYISWHLGSPASISHLLSFHTPGNFSFLKTLVFVHVSVISVFQIERKMRLK